MSEQTGEAAAVCTCPYTPPETWLSAASCGYGGGYEPGSMQEWNPDCPAHPPWGGEHAHRLARDVWDASVAPGGYVCGACGMPTESEPCAKHQWCMCGVVDDKGDGTCGTCGRRIMTDDDEPPGATR